VPCWVATAPLMDDTLDWEAHGFYRTASENDPGSAPFYNFGRGSQALYHQSQGLKQMAISVRCVRD
jgi:hypothetical protein